LHSGGNSKEQKDDRRFDGVLFLSVVVPTIKENVNPKVLFQEVTTGIR